MDKNYNSSCLYSCIICSCILVVTSFNTVLAEEQNPGIDESVELEKMVISSEPVDVSFESTRSIKSQLGIANDGADFLKKTPGFSTIRQGGAASDPLLRGLGGSRLNILIDGTPFAGVCNHRMDPATAYISPGSFDNYSLLKGPQSVRYGNSITGAVNFERESIYFDKPGLQVFNQSLFGSYDQHNLSTDISAGFKYGYLNYNGNRSSRDNYKDGNGDIVGHTITDENGNEIAEGQTQFSTWNDRYALGITPNEDTLAEFSLLRSDGAIANATIHMDATDLDRTEYAFHFKRDNLFSWLKNIDLKYSYTTVDHLMDDFSLRTPGTGIGANQFIVMGQDWRRNYAKGELTFEPFSSIELITGVEYKKDEYDANARGGVLGIVPIPDLSALLKENVVNFENFAGYTELAYDSSYGVRWVGGLRGDTLLTTTGAITTGGQTGTTLISGANQRRRQNLWSGFMRGEYAFSTLPMVFSAGYGHAERAADYWEVFSMDAFAVDAEKNHEADAMLSYSGEKFTASISAFYSRIDDFILVFNGVSALNVDAERFGGELALSYDITDELSVNGDLSYTHGNNLSQHVPLAQTPPLEGKISLKYSQGPFSGSFTTRIVNAQDRIHAEYGNVLGVDNKLPTPGFTVHSLQLTYQPHETVELAFGVDNLTNKTYAEHLSRQAAGFGVGVGGRINEPGRTFWGRVEIDFDI